MIRVSATRRAVQLAGAAAIGFALIAIPATVTHGARISPSPATYTNPLPIAQNPQQNVQSCGDPSIIRGQTSGDTAWYAYCTTDPLNPTEAAAGKVHLIPMLKSTDLVHWNYVGDAFGTPPSWIKPGSCLVAPNVVYMNNKYYLYYTACDTVAGGNAIGVATSTTPTGPWTDSGGAVVEPSPAYCCPGSQRPMDNSTVVNDNGQLYIAYGSLFGGISMRTLSSDGLHSDPNSEKLLAIDNKYEGAYLFKNGSYWYLLVSDGPCCNGPLSGYSIKVGRSSSVTGPYLDQQGHPLLDGRAGGIPILAANGNEWVGTGAGQAFQDASGKWWMVYEAVNRNDPYFTGTTWTKRPMLLDPIDWDKKGWPQVRNGLWASDTAMPGPAAVAGETSAYTPSSVPGLKLGKLNKKLSDNFSGKKMRKGWTWVRDPGKARVYLRHGKLNFVSVDSDLYLGVNNAPVLTEPAPAGNYVVDVKEWTGVPGSGCCYNYIQAGPVIYATDDNYIKFMHVSIWNTRQTEYGKETPSPNQVGTQYAGAPSDWTWLRIVKTSSGSTELYQAYSSDDGKNWVRAGVWTNNFGAAAKIGISAWGGSALNKFDYIHVHALKG